MTSGNRCPNSLIDCVNLRLLQRDSFCPALSAQPPFAQRFEGVLLTNHFANPTQWIEIPISTVIATGRLKHNERVAPAPTARIPAGLSVKEKMARKLRTKKGRAEYARRKAMAEPPFGQIKHCRGFRQFLLRGMEKMKAEWNLFTATHNLLKLCRSGAFATN